jgi:hypothetical protein
MEASELMMISPRRRVQEAFSAAVFPPRVGILKSSTPRLAYSPTIASVRSVDASDRMRIWRRSGG